MLLSFGAYGFLFITALGAASILPLQSEPVLVAMILSGKFSLVSLIVVASVGNTLGSLTNWLLGRGIERFKNRRWFPVKDRALTRGSDWYRRYGKWSLLLSWMPIFGDAICVVAGVLREPLLTFTVLVLTAKTGRYVVLALLTVQVVG